MWIYREIVIVESYVHIRHAHIHNSTILTHKHMYLHTHVPITLDSPLVCLSCWRCWVTWRKECTREQWSSVSPQSQQKMVLVGRERGRGKGRERDGGGGGEGGRDNWEIEAVHLIILDRHPSVPLVPGGGEVIEMDHVIKLAPTNHYFIFNDHVPLQMQLWQCTTGYP